MPEGDSLKRIAQRLAPLVGEQLEVESSHPRAAGFDLPARLGGRRLEAAEAIGKHLLLRFEGGLVLRSHLRMHGRWTVVPRGAPLHGRPWLVLRGSTLEARQWNGPVLEVTTAADAARRLRARRLGPDLLADGADPSLLAVRLRAAGPSRTIGEALLDQRLIAGIGNMWKAEALWAAGISPWAALGALSDDELTAVCAAALRLMSASVAGAGSRRLVYRHAGRPCPRCGGTIRSFPQGEEARLAYWCPGCQGPPGAGAEPAGA